MTHMHLQSCLYYLIYGACAFNVICMCVSVCLMPQVLIATKVASCMPGMDRSYIVGRR
jgi:hypothetical protein